MRLAGLIFIATFSGCGAKPCPVEVRGRPSFLPLFEVGTEYEGRVGLVLPGARLCRDAPLTVKGAVLDADNVEVPSEWTADTELPGAAVLRFTPRSAGPHHLAVAFEPNVGLAQADIFAATRSQRAPIAELSLPADIEACDVAHVLPGGAFVCSRNIVGSRTDVIVDGGVVQTFFDTAVDDLEWGGDVLWMIGRDNGLQRWVYDGAGMSLAESTPATYGARLAATEREAYVVHGEGLSRYWLDGGALVREPLGTVGRAAIRSTISLTADGLALWSAGDPVCLTAVRGADAGQRCFTSTGVSRTDSFGAWSVTNVISLLQEDGGVLTAAHPGHQGTPPIFWTEDRGAASVSYVAPFDGGLRYERFDAPYLRGELDRDRLYLYSPGKVTIFAR